MLNYAAVLFLIALTFAVFGFGGIDAAAAGIVTVLSLVFLVLFLVSIFGGQTLRDM